MLFSVSFLAHGWTISLIFLKMLPAADAKIAAASALISKQLSLKLFAMQ